MRYLVLAVSILAILAFAALTAIELENNGVTFAGVVGVGVLIVVGVGVIGAALHPPRK
jgi:uncharacterized membrane protein